ncbi:hypothetical protein KTT_23470 [Tengunoibacter tsumagoiensis]|uniref:Uncharacterized protein n=2 Tax=Tengunoibacter tsumagoiensis TaxID=2014871 RepID=A0A402A024_9CHLR|nr:hypothetical protein KTT_23470 [Tengunoibacter tsumagoiensis]
MSELSAAERRYLDEAFELLKTTRRTMSDREALRSAKQAGYDLKLSADPSRFTKAEGRLEVSHGQPVPPHWRLVDQQLANARLLTELQTGSWDGLDLDQKLIELEQEDGVNYTFYPHDPRLFQNHRGGWEARGERQITLPLNVLEELNGYQDTLQCRWTELNRPFILRQIVQALEELGWRHEGISSVDRYVRAWLLTTERFRRVGPDYWIVDALLPAEVKRVRLSVPVMRSPVTETEEGADKLPVDPASTHNLERKDPAGEIIAYKGTVTQTQVSWTATLLSIHLLEGFIPLPQAVRWMYPPLMQGEEGISLFKGLWYQDGESLWLWLDRRQHRLYGPDLLEKIGWLEPGTRLKIEWKADGILLREAGLDQEVQQEESRLIDLDELKVLRAGKGESYRQALQALLTEHQEGLTFKEIIGAIRERQNHQVARRTIRSILSSCGFIHRDQRWFAAPDNQQAAKKLRGALLETFVPPSEDNRSMNAQERVVIQVKAIRQRLQEITSQLCEFEKA